MAKRGVNKVILVGNLGQDPETKYLPSGNAVTNLTLATSESYKDKNTGEQKETTEWHRIAIFGKLAEIAGEYLRKGSQVYFEGKLQTRKWQDQQGQDRYTTEVMVDSFDGVMQMLGSKEGGNQSQQNNAPAQNQGGYQQPQQQQRPQYNQAPQQQSAPQQQEQPTYQQGSPQAGGYQQQQGGFNPNQPSDNIPF